MPLNRRNLLKTLAASLAVATTTTLPALAFAKTQPAAVADVDTPVRWVGFGPQKLHDVLNGNVPVADVHQLRMHPQEYAAVVADIRAYRDNGMPEEYERRIRLLKQVAVDWMPAGDNRHGWMRATAEEMVSLPRNRARFFFDYEGSMALASV